jgi:uncharacterized protein (TIGR03437 family)
MKRTKSLRLGAVLLFGAALANAGVTYTCDPTVTALSATACTTLNTTIAGLYNNTFSSANASIYVTLGQTDLGGSLGFLNFVTYSQFLAKVTANATASGNAVLTAAVTALNTYAKPIYGKGQVELTTALARNLGFTNNANQIVGITGDGNTFCNNLGGSGCYDGIVTITNDPTANLYFRTGTEKRTGFDFFGVVEHETDEILGTSSCISTGPRSLSNGCDFNGLVGTPSAVDLFRFSAPGKLIAVTSLSTTPGAYFSYDGGVTNGANGAFYNTLPNGDDYADFVSNCSVQHIQDAEACEGRDANIDITNDGGAEINILNAIGYTLAGSVVTPPGMPVISQSGVVAHGGKSTTIEAGAFIDIYGSNLSQTSRAWNPPVDFTNGGTGFPTSLDGISVKIDGIPAYVYYVSSGLINVQAPDDAGRTGSVNVTVTNSAGTSAPITATLGQVGPTFFTSSDGKHVVGEIPSATGAFYPGTSFSYDLVGPAAQGIRPAKKGETVELFASGFGAGSTPVPAGKADTVIPSTTVFSPVIVIIDGVSQTVPAYIIGAGLWQINVTIPQNVGTGDLTLQATVDGVTTPTSVAITVQ